MAALARRGLAGIRLKLYIPFAAVSRRLNSFSGIEPSILVGSRAFLDMCDIFQVKHAAVIPTRASENIASI
jgi:hypothetical protein